MLNLLVLFAEYAMSPIKQFSKFYLDLLSFVDA